MTFPVWLQTAHKLGASDLHLETDTPVLARIREELVQIAERVPDAEIERAARLLVRDSGWAQLEKQGSADHSTTYGGIRCRVNVYRTVRGTGLAIRLLATTIKDLRNCIAGCARRPIGFAPSNPQESKTHHTHRILDRR